MASDVTITDRHVLFWRGWPSQWIKSPFVVDAVPYGCCEQYMMAEKARIFADDETLAEILRSASPREQQALGRRVKRFELSQWNRVCRGVVYTANVAKFSQDLALAKLLLDTGDRQIVEASPVDRIWGIGLGQEDPRAVNESQWLGSNWLGVALMQARQTVRAAASGQSPSLDGWLVEQLEERKKLPVM